MRTVNNYVSKFHEAGQQHLVPDLSGGTRKLHYRISRCNAPRRCNGKVAQCPSGRDGAKSVGGNGIYCLIPVTCSIIGAHNFRHLEIQATNVPEGVIYPAQLEAQLLFIAHVPKVTAAAFTENRTVGRSPCRGGYKQLFAPAVNSGGANLHQLYLPGFTRKGPGYKNSPATNPADPQSPRNYSP